MKRDVIRKREQDPFIGGRIRILQWIAAGLFLVLAFRLYWLQVFRHDQYRSLSENNRIRVRTIRAPRGLIVDRKGRPIAETQPSFGLVCSPVDVADLGKQLSLLAEVVEIDVGEVREKVEAALAANPYSSIPVARDLSFEQVSVLEFNREALPGFSVMVEAMRSYPLGPEFAHVLGYVGEANERDLEAPHEKALELGDFVGKFGLERSADGDLRGLNGGRRVEVDALGRDKRLVEEVLPRTGGTVHTALDLDLQRAAYGAMKGKAGAAIAIDPRTGDVLAFVSTPSFDPNAFARGIRREEWGALVGDPRKPLQNKGHQGTYAPGSTVKPLLAMAALETGVVDPRRTVTCTGSLPFGNRSFRCWKEHGHGPVDLYKAIVQSCDVYFYKLGLALGPERAASMERAIGLGVLTGIGLPGEQKGLVPDEEWKRTVMKDRWQEVESLLLGIGQGAIHVTPLGMLTAYSSLGSGGRVMRPRLVTRVVRMDGTEAEFGPEAVRTLPWKPEHVAFLRKALSGVVNDFGTGGAARLPGTVVGGKTGTAQVASVKGKMIKSEHLPYEIRDHAWFVGFAPVEDPEIAVVALVEHGGHGGSVAAPVVKAVMQEHFRKARRAGGPPEERDAR